MCSRTTIILIAVLGCLSFSGSSWAKSEGYAGLEVNANFVSTSTPYKMDPGPGFEAFLGYDWGIIGLRGSFFYAHMNHHAGQISGVNGGTFPPTLILTTGNEDSNLFGGMADLKIRPLGMTDLFLQPYIAGGVGVLELDSGVAGLQDVTAFAMHLALGLDWNIGDHFGLFIEGDWKPALLSFSNPGSFQDEESSNGLLNLVSVGAGARVRF